MRAIRFITASYAEQVAAHRRIHITACLAAFAVMLVNGVVVQSAAALGPGVSDTPSTTEPYYACPHGLCDAVIDPPVTKTKAGYELPDGGPLLEGSGEGGGYDPKDLQSAYNIPTSGGSEQTVAVVDAYGDTTAESDLAQYREKYELPACTKASGCFKKVNQQGEEGKYLEAGPAGWELETSLDLDMVSAACPHCHILLVEATTEGMSNLGASVNKAVELGATEVSNSYGAPEDYEPWCGTTGCSQYDSDYNHPGVVITASVGDYGYDNEFFGASVSRPSFPATSPYVVAVGGTSLHKASNSRGWSEKVWYESGRELGTGSGCSGFESKPTWQTDTGCTKRTDNDVAAVGACETPVSIYTTTYGGWEKRMWHKRQLATGCRN
jgi:subtilase family serine protease